MYQKPKSLSPSKVEIALLSITPVLMSVSILLKNFVPGTPDFLIGFLHGLSLVGSIATIAWLAYRLSVRRMGKE